MPRAMNWVELLDGRERAALSKEFIMRNRRLAIFAVASVAIAGAITAPIAGATRAPIAAKAQSELTTGLARGAPLVIDGDADGIAVDQRPAFHQYIIQEHVPA